MDPASEGGPDLDKNPSCDLLMGSPQLLKANIIIFTFNLSVKTIKGLSSGAEDGLTQTVSAHEHNFSQTRHL